MAVDYLQTLNPENGLARSVRVLRPDGTNSLLWTVAVDIGQDRLDGPDAGIDMSWVGAAGIRRAPTFARAAGEAVERSALIPGEGLDSGCGLPAAPRGACWADISAEPGVKTYAATRYDRDGTESAVAVPAGAVDFPPEPGGTLGLFDPGPSGTAAGIDLAMAARSAAKEIIERSAAMLAWDQPETARRYDLRGNGFGAQVLDLTTAAAGQGVELELVRLPGTQGHAVWMAVALDAGRKVAGAGLGLEQDPSQGVLRAVQESLQIRSLLINLKDFEGEKPVAPPITSEMDRARYWAADASITLIREWLDRIPAANEVPPHLGGSTQAGGQEQPGTWLECLPGYTMVDLTPRLPQAIRDMGWCAVKIFCDTLQPLRMSDALDWNVLDGAPTDKQHQRSARPHPFI
ncbi:MAG: hypothetical protein JWQ75_793 [Pseudarthrobacter sp.]|nr:hypothetical protein [Pseudarthrobacter sp.]